MTRTSKNCAMALICCAVLGSAALAQQTPPVPAPQTPPPTPTEGALLGGQLGPAEIAAGAVVLLGIAIAVAGGDDDTPSTTTSSTR